MKTRTPVTTLRCTQCGERVEPDGYGEYVHAGSRKYICHDGEHVAAAQQKKE